MVIKPSKKQDLISGEKRCHFFTDGWQNFKFNEIFEFISNNTFTRNDLSNTGYVKNIHYGDILTKYNSFLNAEDNGIPYININIDLSKFEIKSYIKSGDIIIADTAEDETVGKAVEIINVNCLMLSGLHTLLCRPKIQFADKFLGYYLNSAYFHNQLIPFIVGTKVSSISRSSISQTCLIVPKIGEQKKIAEALADIDSLICLSKKLITKKKAIKQGAMQELLTGKTRLPGFTGNWEIKKLGEISKIKTGDKNNEQKSSNGKYPFFVRSQKVERIDTYSFDGEAILIPGEGNIGEIFHYINGKFDYHQRVYKISNFPKNISGNYIFYQMKYSFGKYALKNTVKATVDSLRLSTFINYSMSFSNI